jgi:alkanesulfonate monooxygenase SsuD/methylene tetrahydromethanopterin reductase-like flavin-dependent oxidoreductase (luciferase family)
MHFGVSMFHTDCSIPAVELARALEARGFESMWAPGHSHIPVPTTLPPEPADKTLPVLDRWAELIRRANN